MTDNIDNYKDWPLDKPTDADNTPPTPPQAEGEENDVAPTDDESPSQANQDAKDEAEKSRKGDENKAPAIRERDVAPEGDYKRPHRWRKGNAIPFFCKKRTEQRLWPLFCLFWRRHPRTHNWWPTWAFFHYRATKSGNAGREIDMAAVRAIFRGVRAARALYRRGEGQDLCHAIRFLKREQYLDVLDYQPQGEKPDARRADAPDLSSERKRDLEGWFAAFMGAMRFDRSTLTTGKEREVWEACDVLESAGYVHNDIARSARKWREEHPGLGQPTVSQIRNGMGAVKRPSPKPAPMTPPKPTETDAEREERLQRAREGRERARQEVESKFPRARRGDPGPVEAREIMGNIGQRLAEEANGPALERKSSIAAGG